MDVVFFIYLHEESVDVLGEDAGIDYDVLSEASSEMSSSDDEMPQEHWDQGSDDEII